MAFCNWLLSLSTLSKFIYAVEHISTPFLLPAEWPSLIWMGHILSSSQHLGCLHLLAIVNNAVVNIHVQVFVWENVLNSLENMPICGITGLYDNSTCNLLRKCHALSRSSRTIFHSHQRCTRVQFLHVLANTYYLFILAIPVAMKGYLPHCGFDLHSQMTA